MSHPDPEDGRPRVVVRDKRRIDPVTGKVRVPGTGTVSDVPSRDVPSRDVPSRDAPSRDAPSPDAPSGAAVEFEVDEGAIGGVSGDVQAGAD